MSPVGLHRAHRPTGDLGLWVASACVVSSLMLGCGPRILSAGDSEATEDDEQDGDSGDTSGLPDLPEPPTPPRAVEICEAPDAPQEPVELVTGDIVPAGFALLGERVYWADWYFSASMYWTEAELGGPWIEVVANQGAVHEITTDGHAVYWVTNGWSIPGGELLRADPDGTVEVLDGNLIRPASLAVGNEGAWIYYIEGDTQLDEEAGKVLRIRPDGADKQVLADGLGRPWDVAVDDTHAWWVDFPRDDLWRVGLESGAPEKLADGLDGPRRLAVVDGEVWVIDDTGLLRVIPGELPELLIEVEGPKSLAADQAHVYWTKQSGASPSTGALLRTAREDPGVVEEIIAPGVRIPGHVRLDEHAIYWSSAGEEAPEVDGAIMMLCKSALD